MRLFCKLSSSGSSDPYHFGGTRSVLSWETIVHYPRYKLRGQIRLKDMTLFRCARVNILICLFLYSCFKFVFSVSGMRTNTTTLLRRICVVFVYSLFFSFTNFCCVRLQIFSFFVYILLLFITDFCFCFRFDRTVKANYWLKFFCFWFSFERTVGASVRFC